MGTFELSIDHENRIVRVKASGVFLLQQGEEMISAARLKATELSFNILYDIRDTATKADFSDWFQLPRKLDVLNDPQANATRVALLISTVRDESNGYIFYEFVANNFGLQVRAFADEPAALGWLADDSPDAPA